MDRILGCIALVLVVVMVMSSGAEAKHPGSTAGVVNSVIARSTFSNIKREISTTYPIEKAAGAAVTNTLEMDISRTEAHSVSVTLVATQTVSCSVAVQGSWDKTNWSPWLTAVTITATANGVNWDAVDLPTTPWARLVLSSDATYPVTYTDARIICF